MKVLQSARMAACQELATVGVLMLISGLPLGNAVAQDQAKDAPAKGNVYFDDFDRDELGDKYSVVDPDPNRLALSDGKLLIVGSDPRKNIVLLKAPFLGDFVATVKVAMEVGRDNFLGLRYHVDQKELLAC